MGKGGLQTFSLLLDIKNDSSKYCTILVLVGISRIFDFFLPIFYYSCVNLNMPDIRKMDHVFIQPRNYRVFISMSWMFTSFTHFHQLHIPFSLGVEIPCVCCLAILSPLNISNIFSKPVACFLTLSILSCHKNSTMLIWSSIAILPYMIDALFSIFEILPFTLKS